MTAPPMNLFCSGISWQPQGTYTGIIKMSNQNQFKKDNTNLNYSIVFIKKTNYWIYSFSKELGSLRRR